VNAETNTQQESTQEVVASTTMRQNQTISTPGIETPHYWDGRWDWVKLAVGFCLIFYLILLGFVGKYLFEVYGKKYNNENTVPWDYPAVAPLLPGPIGFSGDSKSKTLRFRGAIDEKAKLSLLALFPNDAKGKYYDSEKPNELATTCGGKNTKASTCKNAELAYQEAVNKLSYESNSLRFDTLISLMLVAAVFGAIGSHVRSMSAFVNHMGRGQLNLCQWWPYYGVRPFYGAVFGVLVFVIIKGGFLTTNGQESDPTLWWVSLAFFAGFGDREFAEKIRQIIKALFGESAEISRSITIEASRSSTVKSDGA
jgi:hypothetical protein